MRLPRLYAIIDRATLDARGMGVGAFARELADAGVTLVQYRDKSGKPQRILGASVEISAAFDGKSATLILNDRADFAVLAGWNGVHVGQGDLSAEDARRVLGNSRFPSGMTTRKANADACALVGVSTHTDEQVRVEAGVCRGAWGEDERNEGADYIAIGPVFGTGSKTDAEPVVGLEGVRRARTLTQKPLVAIGGITRENARSVVEAGADSVAVIGGLFVAGMSVGEVARDFLEILR